jgi:hypothetical protein
MQCKLIRLSDLDQRRGFAHIVAAHNRVEGALMYRYLAMACASVAACATPYQKQGFAGGFSETQLDENAFRVAFRGNGYTSHERVADFTLLRSAELTRAHGYHFFIVVQASERTSYSSHTTPTQSTTTASATGYGNSTYVTAHTTTTGGQTYLIAKPGASNTIVCFRDRPDGYEMVYNADFLYRSLTQKYGMPAPDAYTYQAPPVPDGRACKVEADCEIGKWCGRMNESTGRGACIPIGTR